MFEILCREGLASLFDGLGDRIALNRAGTFSHLVDEGFHLTFRLRALEGIDRPSARKRVDRRHGLHSHLLGQRLILVDIDFYQLYCAFGGKHDFLQNRGQLFAGTAP